MNWYEDLFDESPKPVCEKGEFVFAAVGLEHGHINSMCTKLEQAGGVLKWVYDGDSSKAEAFKEKFPNCTIARDMQEVLQDPDIHLVATAAVPSERYQLGIETMKHDKDFFTAKTPFTQLSQLDQVRGAIQQTKRKYAVNYSERVSKESAVFAGKLINSGAIGRVIQIMGMGPHRLNFQSRPDWFFIKKYYGGIICDIGSHQIEQFLYYSGAKDAEVSHSKVANYSLKDYPEFEDFGDATLIGDNGATNYFRVDWLTPNGLSSWGDGRTVILGTKGYIELRKNVDITRDTSGDHVYLVNGEGERYINVRGKVGTPFYGELIKDCLERTEVAMTQEHALKAGELCLRAQNKAIKVE